MPVDKILQYLNGIDEDDTNKSLTSTRAFNAMITKNVKLLMIIIYSQQVDLYPATLRK